jgi:alkylation response protein AidB-like acyl-CoA dehydrogenase
MRSPGLTIRPLRQLTGSAEFSETFFDDVVVPRANLIGAENDGWRVATVTLAHERGTNFSFKEQVLQKISLDELADQLRAPARRRDPVLRQRWAASCIEVEIMRLHNCATMTRLARGELPGAESSIVKLFLGRPVAAPQRPRPRQPRPRRPARRRPLAAAHAVVALRQHRRRHQRDPAQHHRPTLAWLPRN